MNITSLLTAMQIAEQLEEQPQRVTYIIRKYRMKPVHRIGIIRLFSESQAEEIKKELWKKRERN